MERIKTSNFEHRDIFNTRVYNFLRALKDIDNKKNKSVADLGSGHCYFSELASIYFKNVTSVDFRNFRKPNKLPNNVEFIQCNALDYNIDNFDVVFCFGLLYHLTAKEQIELLKKSLGKEVVIDTHMHIKGLEIIREGYRGSEYKEASSIKEMFNNPKASVTTLSSFWFKEDEFIRMLKDIGYTDIIKYTPEHYKNRTFWKIK